MLLACVAGSIIAAMSSSAEDRFSFFLYAALIGLNLLATLTAHDFCILREHFEHYIEPRFLFYGLHAMVLSVLVYFHQGVSRVESDGAKLGSEASSADLGILTA
jgi:hypothetical protein